MNIFQVQMHSKYKIKVKNHEMFGINMLLVQIGHNKAWLTESNTGSGSENYVNKLISQHLVV